MRQGQQSTRQEPEPTPARFKKPTTGPRFTQQGCKTKQHGRQVCPAAALCCLAEVMVHTAPFFAKLGLLAALPMPQRQWHSSDHAARHVPTAQASASQPSLKMYGAGAPSSAAADISSAGIAQDGRILGQDCRRPAVPVALSVRNEGPRAPGHGPQTGSPCALCQAGWTAHKCAEAALERLESPTNGLQAHPAKPAGRGPAPRAGRQAVAQPGAPAAPLLLPFSNPAPLNGARVPLRQGCKHPAARQLPAAAAPPKLLRLLLPPHPPHLHLHLLAALLLSSPRSVCSGWFCRAGSSRCLA